MNSTNQPSGHGATRRAFTLRLKPGAFDKYKDYHDHIWPELVREIEACGIAQITTFAADDQQLFLYSEIHNEAAWDKLWSSAIHDKWGEAMEPLMQFNAEGKVDAGPLREIFHLVTSAGAAGAETK